MCCVAAMLCNANISGLPPQRGNLDRRARCPISRLRRTPTRHRHTPPRDLSAPCICGTRSPFFRHIMPPPLNATGVIVAASLMGGPKSPYQPSDVAHETLPSELSEQRLDLNAPLGAARFVPRGGGTPANELLTSVFSTWNILDALMHTREPDSYFQTGYLRELQVRRMLKLIQEDNVRTYCEIGMNGGRACGSGEPPSHTTLQL